MRRKGFTLIEIIISLMIMATMSGVFMLSIKDLDKQTAHKEADRLYHWLSSKVVRADTNAADFKLELDSGSAVITWNPSNAQLWTAEGKRTYQETLAPSTGCAFNWENAPSGDAMTYNPRTNQFSAGGTIEITGEGEPRFLVIATTGSRMRLSDTAR